MVKYMYFKVGALAEYDYVVVQTDSEDKREIMRLAREEAEAKTGKSVKLMDAAEI
jgi:hypothetical protein